MGCPGLRCDLMRFPGRGPRRRRAERAPVTCRASGRLLSDQVHVDRFLIEDERTCSGSWFFWLRSNNSTASDRRVMKIVAWVRIAVPFAPNHARSAHYSRRHRPAESITLTHLFHPRSPCVARSVCEGRSPRLGSIPRQAAGLVQNTMRETGSEPVPIFPGRSVLYRVTKAVGRRAVAGGRRKDSVPSRSCAWPGSALSSVLRPPPGACSGRRTVLFSERSPSVRRSKGFSSR